MIHDHAEREDCTGLDLLFVSNFAVTSVCLKEDVKHTV